MDQSFEQNKQNSYAALSKYIFWDQIVQIIFVLYYLLHDSCWNWI